ncbi:MAG TPA: hypothetical protein VEW69_06370 [Alphaproteobacteria bacterium]|nr:hypothetical protein [Alphaproteobacteria bacterium]
MFEFGSGSLWGLPIAGGAPNLNPTPTKFGTLQDVTVDIHADIKQLYGQKQFPEAVARGKMKISGKAKSAWINGKMYNDLYFGQPLNAAGMVSVSLDEAATVPASPGPYTYPAAKTAFKQDWGVRYASGAKGGQPLTFTTGTPSAGQYGVSVAAGVGTYTFASADAGAAVVISYTYLAAAPSGAQLNINNQLMGFAPTIQVLLNTIYNGNQFSVMLYACVASKLTFTTKQEDFIVPEFDFEAFANSAGQVIDIYSSE